MAAMGCMQSGRCRFHSQKLGNRKVRLYWALYGNSASMFNRSKAPSNIEIDVNGLYTGVHIGVGL